MADIIRGLTADGAGNPVLPPSAKADLDPTFAEFVDNPLAETRHALSRSYAETGLVLHELRQDFTHAQDGAPANADSGQVWTHTSNNVDGAHMTVIDGKLTNTATNASVAAGYLTAELAAPARVISAEFGFDGASGTGAITLGAWVSDLVEGTMGAVPNTPVHLVIDRTKWMFGYFKDGPQVIVRQKNFRTQLSNSTTHRVSVEIEYETETVRLLLPDGTVENLTVPGLAGFDARFPFLENYQNNASTDAKPYWTSFAADSNKPEVSPKAVTPSALGRALDARERANKPWIKTFAPASPATSVPTQSFALMWSNEQLSQEVYAPESGKLLVELSIWVEMTDDAGIDSSYYVQVFTNRAYATRTMGHWVGKHRGWLHYRAVIDDMSPGSYQLIRFMHRTTGTTNYVSVSADGGRPATLKVTPL